SLLDRVAEPPPELVGAALLPELRAAIQTGPAPALALCERPSARALFASEALAEERAQLARECVLRPGPLTQGVKSYAPLLAWLRLSGRIRPPSARCSTDVIERLDEVLGVLMIGLMTGGRAERKLRCDVILACAEVAPWHVKLQQDVAGMVEFLFNVDRPAFEPVVRRALRLSAGDEQTLTQLRVFLSMTILAGDPASEEGWRVGLAVRDSERLERSRRLLLLDQLLKAAERSGQQARGADLALEVARLAFAAGQPERAQRALRSSAELRRRGAAEFAPPERERAEQRAAAVEEVLKQIEAGAAVDRVEAALRALESE
ncbi:MAG TPA: hypothetical protein DEA08_18825, partial [Planctomycetes bacterium]|nr:hypothetical protein [Planctomycetota bacterium]